MSEHIKLVKAENVIQPKLDTSQVAETESQENWDVLAERNSDRLYAVVRTLGTELLANTHSWVIVNHSNGVSIDEKGPLAEVWPIYSHPMVYVTEAEARTAYPPPNQRAA